MQRGAFVLLFGAALLLLGSVLLFVMRDAGPPAAMSQSADAIKSRAGPSAAEWAKLRDAAERGDATAQNNLGVAYLRAPDQSGTDKKAQARAWFEKAAEQDHIQARYNLALLLPDRHRTDPEIISRRLALLQKNVSAGDVPSMVALARSLYFANREAFVPDRKQVRRKLLAQASASGDADYLVTYGKTLWNDVRGGDDPALLADALPALHAAFEAGEPRGAETIGAILSSSNPAHREIMQQVLSEQGLEGDPLVWFRRAADLGLVTAQCRYGFELFRTRSWIRTPDMGLIERHFRAGADVLGASSEKLTQAIADLEVCASNPKRRSEPRLPFGEKDLYAYKLRGTWTAMTTQPGWANITLGVLYGYGIAVERAPNRARRYLETAAEQYDFDIAREIIDALPEF